MKGVRPPKNAPISIPVFIRAMKNAAITAITAICATISRCLYWSPLRARKTEKATIITDQKKTPHPTPPIVYVVEGTLSVDRKDGETVHTEAGQAVIEPVNTIIRGTNKGETPVKLVIFQVSPPEVPESHPAPSQ